MDLIKDIGDLTLEELESFNIPELIQEYQAYLASFMTNRIAKHIVAENYGDSINNIAEIIFETELECTSRFISFGDLIYYYPNDDLRRSVYHHVCVVSGDVIPPKKMFYKFKPFLENISKNQVMFSKKAFYLKEEYGNFIPKSLNAFEEMLMNLSGFRSEITFQNISFDDIATRMGEGLEFYIVDKNSTRKRKKSAISKETAEKVVK